MKTQSLRRYKKHRLIRGIGEINAEYSRWGITGTGRKESDICMTQQNILLSRGSPVIYLKWWFCVCKYMVVLRESSGDPVL